MFDYKLHLSVDPKLSNSQRTEDESVGGGFGKQLKRQLVRYMVPMSVSLIASVPTWAQTELFEEVANASGISYVGQSWGSAWGDFDGDGWFDLWVSNHGEAPSLFLNQQDGTFVDIAEQVIPADVWTYYQTTLGSYDSHGSMWLDVDRDGDVDLFQGADGNNRNQPNQLLINDSGTSFEDEIAFLAGVAANTISVRRPVALDFNGDGFVDIVTANSENSVLKPPLSFYQSNLQQGEYTFTEVTNDFALILNEKPQLAFISDLDQDNKLEITAGPTPNFVSVYEFDQNALVEITADLNLVGSQLRGRRRDG